MSLTTEIVTDRARLALVRDAWQSLWDRCGIDIFQHHAWIAGWVDAITDRGDARPLIGLAWEGDRLVAAMPCAVHRQYGVRTLQWAAQRLTDYCDALVDVHAAEPRTLQRLWAAMRAGGGFDVVHLRQVRPDARARRLLDEIVRESGGLRLQPRQERCMRIDCAWPDGEKWFRSLNKKARNNHTRGKRILSELGGQVVFRMLDPGTPVMPVVDEILAMKRDWMRVHHPDSPFLGPDIDLPRAMIEAANRTGQMLVFLIECGGRIAAASINFIYETKMQAYLTAYDPAFERASPGTILIVDYTKWAFDRGLRLVDFLRGEEAFKFRMANAETELDDFLGARTLLGHAVIAARDLRTRLRRDAPCQPAEDAVTIEDGALQPTRQGGN